MLAEYVRVDMGPSLKLCVCSELFFWGGGDDSSSIDLCHFIFKKVIKKNGYRTYEYRSSNVLQSPYTAADICPMVVADMNSDNTASRQNDTYSRRNNK